jgi:hypothetical protein
LVMFIIKVKEEINDEETQVTSFSWPKKKNCSNNTFKIEDSKNENKQLKNKQELLKRVDQVSFALCFLIFSLFNVIFWKIYL